MKKRTIFFWVLTFFLVSATAQEKYVHNLSKIPNSLNPSFHAFKDKTRIGVLAELASQNQGAHSQHKYVFGTTSFEDKNFQLGLDIFNNNLNKAGYNYTNAALSFIYKLELSNAWLLYPGITAGYSSYRFDFNNLTFQDQINIASGQINAQSIDPITNATNRGFIDLGASVLLHNDMNMLFGLSIKHLNQPSLASNQSEEKINLNMHISGQFGYEIDLNPYGQKKLPEFTYLYLFHNLAFQGSNSRFDLYQDVQFGNFSVGINEHFSFLEEFSFSEVGVATSLTLESFEFGVNYRFPFGANAKLVIPNTVELFLVFDISRFSERRRKNYSRFY